MYSVSKTPFPSSQNSDPLLNPPLAIHPLHALHGSADIIPSNVWPYYIPRINFSNDVMFHAPLGEIVDLASPPGNWYN